MVLICITTSEVRPIKQKLLNLRTIYTIPLSGEFSESSVHDQEYYAILWRHEKASIIQSLFKRLLNIKQSTKYRRHVQITTIDTIPIWDK